MDYKLLIVIPTLNSYKFLPRLVKSLIKQRFTNWRVIFIDGGSLEKHLNYLKKLSIKDKRFSWVYQKEKNLGIFGAMNQGLDHHKKDEFVVFWGSDDWINSDYSLEKIFYKIQNFCIHQLFEPDLIFCGARYYEQKTLKPMRKSSFYTKEIIFDSKFYNLLIFNGNSPPHQGTIFSPKIIKKIKLYDQTYRLSADLDYFLRVSILKDIKFMNLNTLLINMLKGGESGTNFLRRILEVILVYIKRYKIIFIYPFVMRYVKRILNLREILFKKILFKKILFKKNIN